MFLKSVNKGPGKFIHFEQDVCASQPPWNCQMPVLIPVGFGGNFLDSVYSFGNKNEW